MAVGDVTEDGEPDLVSTVRDAETYESSLVVAVGPFASGSRSVESAPRFARYETPSADIFWAPLALADVNADGTADLYVHSLNAAYVLPGPLPRNPVVLPDGEPVLYRVVVAEGAELGSLYGTTKPTDLDGDGVLDLAFFDDAGLFVHDGPLEGERAIDDASAEIEFSSRDPARSAELLASEDMDGDGYGELVVLCGVCEHFVGQAFLFPGPVQGRLTDGDAPTIWHGLSEDSPLGGMTAGDVDGDGLAELILTDFLYVGVFRRTSPGSRQVWDGDAVIAYSSAGAFDTRLRAVGDLDGDRKDEVLLSGRADSSAIWWLFYGDTLSAAL